MGALGDKRHRRPQVLDRQRRLDGLAFDALDPVGARVRARGHDAREPAADEVQRRRRRRRPSRAPCRPGRPRGSPVAAAAPCRSARRWSRQQPESRDRAALLAVERGQALLEPAQRAGAQAAHHDAVRPCLAQHRVEAVRATSEHRAHAAAADVDQVLLEQVLARVGRAAVAAEQRDVRGLAAARPEVPVEAHDVVVGVARGGGEEADLRALAARRGQHVVVEQPVAGLHREPATAEGHDLGDAGHGGQYAGAAPCASGFPPLVERPWTVGRVKRPRPAADDLRVDIRLSEVISALSYALDVTEGQPMGHAVRSCAIGMRIGEEIGLAPEERSSLFYALLLKDAGCSSNAARLSSLFGADDLELKRTRKLIDHHRPGASLRHVLRHGRTRRLAAIARSGADGAREMTELRCERGADIARMIELSETTAQAIRSLDEHWDGAGYPDGLAGDAIPLFGRILCLAQTAEVFFGVAGPRAALDVAAERRGTWFDPQLVDALLRTRRDRAFWASLGGLEPHRVIAAFEPEDRVQRADEERLDRVAEAFAMIVDAKSPYTGHHSEGVARISVAIADVLGYSSRELRDLRRAALLHDIGKLGVSNLILDKPGKLTEEEWVQMRRHPELTVRILERVGAFRGLAAIAGAHHERLDGGGYHLGLTGDQLGRDARILAVADVCEALTAERPYRAALPPDEVRAIMWRDAGRALCPAALDALAATQELGVLTLATPATAAARPAGR